MDERHFDSLTRRLATRLSRRGAFRASAAVALGSTTLGNAPATIAQDAGTTATHRFVALSYYPYDGDFEDAKTALKPLLRMMQEQPGFITLSFVEEEGQICLVTSFLDKATSDAGTSVMDAWIASSDQTVLSGDPERDSGAVFLRSQQGSGCWCSTEDDDACGTDALVCCGTADDDRGICLPAATTCPSAGDDETVDTEEETVDDPTPTSTATATTSCTGEGCDCVAGVAGTCDDGLSCCGASVLGGSGTCLSSCPCGSEGCYCVAAVISTCDDGLICCAPGEIGGEGTCQYSCACGDEGCACTTGVDGACNDGLSCCGIGSTLPGSIGVCLTACAAPEYCPGNDGCECGAVWKCNQDLVCCGATADGETGICQSAC